MKRYCSTCQIDISNRHKNALRCKKCSADLRKKPHHNLTPKQQKEALRWAGKIYRWEIAEKIGCSNASLARFAKEQKHVNWNAHRYDQKTVQKICDFYLHHTLEQTQEKFPGVTVRSIIDRYTQEVKCYKWTNDEVFKLMKYSGLVPWSYIAVKLGRNKNSARRKYKRILAGRINCLPHNIAREFVNPGCPFFYVRLDLKSTGLWMCPWVTINRYKKQNLPTHIKKAIRAMSNFQLWLHGSENNIIKVLEQKI